MNVGHYGMNLGAPGGIARYVERLGAAQQEAGHTVSYFSSVSPPDDSSLPNCQTVPAPPALRAAAQNAGLDVLHLHDPVSLSNWPLPVLRTMHGNHGSCPGGGRFLAHSGVPCTRTFSPTGCFWHRLTEHCGSRRPGRYWADVQRTRTEMASAESIPTLTVSRFLRNQMERSGVDVHNVQVILSPAPDVATDGFPPPQTAPPRVLFLGRLVPQKGLDWLLEALAHTETQLHLDVAGEGTLDEYRTLARTLDVADRVTFHGWVDASRVSALIAQSRAVVFPSMWAEPAGLVTLEAAAHGRAVIASRAGGIPEYADPSFSLLVPPGDVEALAARMDLLASDAALATAMGQRGQRYVRRHHGMSTFLAHLSDCYTDAIDAWNSRSASSELAVPQMS